VRFSKSLKRGTLYWHWK